ncbi:MAG: UTRA domain-containing protein [[Clostridium] innocuum]
MEASVKVADRLQIEPGESITYLKRLRLLNGKIIALHESHISSRIGIEICEDDFDTTTSLYEYLEENGISLGSADDIEVKMASFELRRDLL